LKKRTSNIDFTGLTFLIFNTYFFPSKIILTVTSVKQKCGSSLHQYMHCYLKNQDINT